MFKNLHYALTLSAIMAFGALSASAATGDPVSIPTSPKTFIDWNNATITGAKIENNGANIGSTGASTEVVFNLVSTSDGAYTMTIATGHKGTAYMDITLSDQSGKDVFTGVHKIENTGSWTPSTTSTFDIPTIPAGSYTLTLKPRDLVDSNYAGNWGNLALYDANADNTEHIPGAVTIANASLIGGARNEGQNIGYIKDGCGTSHEITVDQEGVYAMTLPLSKYGDGILNITVTDKATKAVEAETHWTIPAESANYTPQTINVEGELTTGGKTLKLIFNASHTGFIANYKDMSFEKIADHCATFRGVTIDGQEVTAGEGYDWNCNLPLDYTSANTTLKVNTNDNTVVTATATDGQGNAVAVTDNGDGTFSIPTPAGSTETIVTFNVAGKADDVLVFRDTYTIRLYHIGDIIINALTIDDVDAPAELIAALNAAGDNISASLTDWIFTAEPTIVATFADNSKATATGSVNGAEGTFTFKGTAGDRTKTYTINISGFHFYSQAEGDEMVKLVYDSALNQADGSWSNGSYTLNPCGDGWGGTQFKFKNNTEIELSIPSNVVIKQIKFTNLKDNYTPGTIGYVTSGDATVYLPTATYFRNGDGVEKNVYVNFEGHKAGTPVKFLFTPGSQPVAWFEILIEKQAITSSPVVNSSSTTPTANVNHTVATLNFDREMKSATATVAGQTVEGEVTGAVVRFKVWDLPYNTTSQLVIAAGNAEDTFGNVNDTAITLDIEVGAPTTVEAIEPIVVGTVDEWKAALAQVNASNTSADAPRAVIFVKNGDYDFGAEEQHINRAYNVSVIGESREGVILHGNRTGISNPVVSSRYSSDIYFQDLTIRNDLDWGKERGGVGVAFYGGNSDILRNVELQSQQDTYVSGEKGYYDACIFHGAVDYICGGGDHYFDHCDLVMTNGGAITAPSTSANNKYGYVFESNTIKGTAAFSLGRPWQNEPRAYFLNTTFEAPMGSDAWTGMSNIPTHFYEYNSMDKNGNALDLSGRKNSPTSTNSYTPVLTAAEAAHFTVRNVLCGNNSWDPSSATKQCAAPANASIGEGLLTWNPVEGASAYAIFRNGEYVAHVTNATEYEILSARDAEANTYTIRAANAFGGLGEASEAVLDSTTGIDAILDGETSSAIYYNLQGTRVDADAKGVLIRVDILPDGSRRSTKVVK